MKDPSAQGQTLIGVLIGLVIIAVLASALFTLTTTSYKLVATNKTKIAARHLAQERIEVIRNMPFDTIGTAGGIPSGNLQQKETVLLNGLTYSITTSIVYVDDPFDQTAPYDLLPTDYKRVRIDVGWEGPTITRNIPVVLVTDISQRGIETTQGGGTLSILVFDAEAQPVPQAEVTIQTVGLNPNVNLTLETNDNGRIVLPGSPECIECYDIAATKDNFSTDKTYTVAQVANPSKPLVSIIENQVTEVSFAIDRLSTLNITSTNDRDSGFTVRPNTALTLHGEKAIGTDINDLPVYKYSEILTTNELGTIKVDGLEWDNYTISPSGNDAIAGTNPFLPILLVADSETDLDFAVSPSTGGSLLLGFEESGVPIASVSATLTNSPDYEVTQLSGNEGDPDFGQVFFPDLEPADYQLSATASGYQTYSEGIKVGSASLFRLILLNTE